MARSGPSSLNSASHRALRDAVRHTVAVTESGGRLLVTDTATGEVVADHAPVAPGEASADDARYGGPRPAPRRAVRPKTAAEKAFCALGPVAEAFLTGSAASGSTRLAAIQAAHGKEAPPRNAAPGHLPAPALAGCRPCHQTSPERPRNVAERR